MSEKNSKIDQDIAELKTEDNLPRHIAIIMDGNGRWAKERMLPRISGHKAGIESVRAVISTCAKLDIPILSLYTFSIENWNRPAGEVKALMKFLEKALESEFLELKNNNIKLEAMGRLDMLPGNTRRVLEKTIKKLSDNTGTILNLCLSYSGKAEIIDAVKKIGSDVKNGSIDVDSIGEKLFSNYLYSPKLCDPDLLIRTGGEFRISNFLLWQLAYTEIVVSDIFWPDFRGLELLDSIREYLGRERRFGRVKSE
ncbi:MAG: isoprenyl transferase [Candidatus Krumholzibacteriota bacterium]|nr:isoprenyl transferase [Candidatus Krumholzibacteriota bacterium]